MLKGASHLFFPSFNLAAVEAASGFEGQGGGQQVDVGLHVPEACCGYLGS